LYHEVVDRHGNKINADRLVTGRFNRDLDLSADAISCRDQDRIGEAGGFEIEKSAEAADFRSGARPRGCAHQWLDQFHHAVAGIDVDTSGRVASVFHEITDADSRE
jgi:hypothetical protein